MTAFRKGQVDPEAEAMEKIQRMSPELTNLEGGYQNLEVDIGEDLEAVQEADLEVVLEVDLEGKNSIWRE